jgi:hypothetical protein
MPRTLTFLHTSPVHVATFERLLAELAPDVPATHVVDETLLDDARAHGLTPELAGRVAAAVAEARDRGAGVVLCSCSTIGALAEQVGAAAGAPVLRVDRAMAERAVELGQHIVVAAALESTLAPTRELLLDAAARAGKSVAIVEVLCEGAWQHFEQGDFAAYHQAIAGRLHGADARGDAIVLAQASMAGAAPLCADLGIPVLSSPRLGLEAALEAFRARGKP